MPIHLEWNVDPESAGERLDTIAAVMAEKNGIPLSRSAIKSRNIPVSVNGAAAKLSTLLRAGDHVSFDIPDPEKTEVKPEALEFDVLYQDDDVAVVHKPYGMAVHPSHGHPGGTLVNGLLHRLDGKLSSIGGVERPGIVHRLDKDTDGILLIALNDASHQFLSKEFSERRVRKIYQAVVKGKTPKSGTIQEPIGRSEHDRKKMGVRPDGKPAWTDFKTLEYLNGHSWLEIELHTGRTHQIRVHLSYLGFPIAGDPLYSRNSSSYRMPGIALCAKKIGFTHPSTGKWMEFEIELPEAMKKLIERLR